MTEEIKKTLAEMSRQLHRASWACDDVIIELACALTDIRVDLHDEHSMEEENRLRAEFSNLLEFSHDFISFLKELDATCKGLACWKEETGALPTFYHQTICDIFEGVKK